MDKLLLLKSDDWEGLYINGTLVEEGHKIGEGRGEEYWFSLGKTYNRTTLICKWVTKEDEKLVQELGNFPMELHFLTGRYYD